MATTKHKFFFYPIMFNTRRTIDFIHSLRIFEGASSVYTTEIAARWELDAKNADFLG